MLAEKSIANGDLPASLEEFGLSKYEAKAYLTMIGKGSLAASDLAYYANLPRTKVYQTVKKLEKKRLAVVSKQKPLICSAIPPEEAFGEILNLHERRVKSMRKIVERLQKINDEGQRPKSSEERRYFILDPDSALSKVGNLVASSRSSVTATLDSWGLRLLSQCKGHLVRALTNGVRIRLAVDTQCAGSESLSLLPDGIEVRMAAVQSSVIIFDSRSMVSVDSRNGKAALFMSLDVYGAAQLARFEDTWNRATDLKYVLNAQPVALAKAFELSKMLENGISAHILDYAINGEDPSIELLDVIEKQYGLRLADMKAAEMLDVADSVLKITCLGGLKYDKSNNIVSLQSKTDGRNALLCAFVLLSYFRLTGNEARIIQNKQSLQTVHLKLSRPIA